MQEEPLKKRSMENIEEVGPSDHSNRVHRVVSNVEKSVADARGRVFQLSIKPIRRNEVRLLACSRGFEDRPERVQTHFCSSLTPAVAWPGILLQS